MSMKIDQLIDQYINEKNNAFTTRYNYYEINNPFAVRIRVWLNNLGATINISTSNINTKRNWKNKWYVKSNKYSLGGKCFLNTHTHAITNGKIKMLNTGQYFLLL